jgi:hypothetical protein
MPRRIALLPAGRRLDPPVGDHLAPTPRHTHTSLRDRLVTRHEMIFLFVTQPGYYFVGVPRLWLTPDL